MTKITADLVKTLRQRTSVGMMECKKALVAAKGDIEKAIEDLRKAGQAKAVKKGGRTAAEGMVVICTAKDNKQAVMLEVNCETDFVAREDKFKDFANMAAEVALTTKLQNVEELKKQKSSSTDKSVEDVRLELVTQLGENIAIRRLNYLQATDGIIGSYTHGSGGYSKIGALITISSDKVELAKDLAMQVAAMKPEYIDESKVESSRIAKEKEIFLAQVRENNQGKPEEILEKIISGKLKKFIREITLVGQASIKDSNKTIENVLKEENSTVLSMTRFEVGEGIEKQADNFVDEVMSQIKNSD